MLTLTEIVGQQEELLILCCNNWKKFINKRSYTWQNANRKIKGNRTERFVACLTINVTIVRFFFGNIQLLKFIPVKRGMLVPT